MTRCLTTGLIPARAGNTGGLPRCPGVGRAHPRSRGEHRGNPSINFSRVGSSPLARGTRFGIPEPDWKTGLIPARAGNTATEKATGHFAGAHPRSRGEHTLLHCSPVSGLGSSPLARGTLPSNHVENVHSGLIPARAGNTRRTHPGGDRGGAHPRSRGEHLYSITTLSMVLGSSPLARGTRLKVFQDRADRGLIPARAGNTSWVR